MKNFNEYLDEEYQKPKIVAKPIEPFQTQIQRLKKEYEPYRKMYEKMFGGKKKDQK